MRPTDSGNPGGDTPFLTDVRADLPWQEWAFPGILAILLSIPCLGFTYMWDDYAFLGNAFRSSLSDFLPNPHDPFYRPIARGLYFYILLAARDHGALLGHIINAVTLGLCASLLAAVGARLAGRKVGLLSGIIFAGLSCTPVLVAWTCCSQDLLAMLFVLLAIHFRLSDRPWAALGCVALGIACKETTIATIPAIVAAGWIRGRRSGVLAREAIAYASLVTVWALIHPGMRVLIGRSFRPGRTMYVGLAGVAETIKHVGQYLLEVCNLRVGKLDWTWAPWEFALLVACVVVAVIVSRHLIRSRQREVEPAGHNVILFGALLGIGPLLLTSAMILGASQYYAAFPALGSSLILGAVLARRSQRQIVGVIAVFLLLGLWSRATATKEVLLTEGDFRVSSDAHVTLKRNFMRLQPSLPSDSQVLISVQAHGRLRVYHQIYVFQTPSLWYWDKSLVTRKPENRSAGGGPEFLFAVSQDLDVVRIDPATLQIATSSGRPPDYFTVEQALRTYSMGLAGSGETEAAARMLVEMPEVDASFESFHHRMAVMFLLADGREEDARRLEAGIPPATRSWALDNLPAILAQQPASRNFDIVGLKAFGIDTTDVDALRQLTGWYLKRRYALPGGRFANRLLRFAPHDSIALAAAFVCDSVVTARARLRIPEE